LQYVEQMLDIFSCNDLVLCMFYFITGLPVKTKEEELMEDFNDDNSSAGTISSYHSRLSMSIEGNMLSIERRHIPGGAPSTNASVRDSRQ